MTERTEIICDGPSHEKRRPSVIPVVNWITIDEPEFTMVNAAHQKCVSLGGRRHFCSYACLADYANVRTLDG